MPHIKAKVKRQMKFYRYLVVEMNFESDILQVIPYETKAEAETALEEFQKFRGVDHFFMAEARIDDDWNLFWSGTTMGHPLESGEGI